MKPKVKSHYSLMDLERLPILVEGDVTWNKWAGGGAGYQLLQRYFTLGQLGSSSLCSPHSSYDFNSPQNKPIRDGGDVVAPLCHNRLSGTD